MYQYRDPRECTGYVPALPPRVVFRRNALDPFPLELFIELTAPSTNLVEQSESSPAAAL